MNQETQTPILNATDKETFCNFTLHLVKMSKRTWHETSYSLLSNTSRQTRSFLNLINRHNVCASYSCNENMKTFIDRHNKAVLNSQNKRERPEHTTNSKHDLNYDCRHLKLCPANGYCLTSTVIYKAEVTTTDFNDTQSYIGATANDFKTRYRNHRKSMTHRKYSNETKLFKDLLVA